jgi:hypothetical protein
MPELYSFTKNNLISVKAALETEEISQLLHLPISDIAFDQLQ